MTLFSYPFEKNIIAKAEGSILVWNAPYDLFFDQFFQKDVVQNFKPHVEGYQDTYQKLPDKHYDFIFCALSKQNLEAQWQLAHIVHHLKTDGVCIVIAANDAGGKQLEKWMKQIGFVVQSLSKSKHRICIGHVDKPNEKVIQEALSNGAERTLKIEGQVFVTKPGIFGWDKIDMGSKLLAENWDGNFSGQGADFGCGYGYLTTQLLAQGHLLEKLYSIDTDAQALNCAKQNILSEQAEFLWEDLTQFHLSDLDWIIMNPPFHAGKKTDSDIGQKFIENAAKSLEKDGILWMVANKHLPYEKTLDTYFSHKDCIKEQSGFKIFKAIK